MKRLRLPVLFVVAILCAGAVLSQEPEEIRSRIRRQPVVSTNVASIGYSRKLRALEIEFARGAVYRFLEVPGRVYQQLMVAQSKGHFIVENIRGKYRFVRVRPRSSTNKNRRRTNEWQLARASPAP